MNQTFILPCSWQMVGQLNIEAETLEAALEIAYGPTTSLPDGEYMSDSFTVDIDAVTEEASVPLQETLWAVEAACSSPMARL